MKYMSAMIKPASGLCNMRCSYCFYTDLMRRRKIYDYGIMSAETAFRIVNNILMGLGRGDMATLAFQGGEPTLAGIPFFTAVLDHATHEASKAGIRIEFALQTNGSLINEEWISLLKGRPVLIGLSMDGYMQLHNSNRKGTDGGDTYKSVLAAKKLFDQHGIRYNVMATLTNQAARHPFKMWKFIMNERIGFIQFTPCLNALYNENRANYTLEPKRFYQFYSELFPLWAEEYKKGRYISVKLFDDLYNHFAKGMPTSCGINGKCTVQYVCESDGSVFPCDFYMLDEFRMGALSESKPADLYDNASLFLSVGRDYVLKEPCKSCRYFTACNGGCKRMVNAMYLSDGICWYAKLLDDVLEPLIKIVETYSAGIRITGF